MEDDVIETMLEASPDYRLVERAISRLVKERDESPALGALAESLGVSEGKLQRTFSAWAGISPKRFAQLLARDRVVEVLAESKDVLGAALDSGLSGPGRLHDFLVALEAVTPGEVRSRGEGLAIRHGTGETPFGEAFVAWTDRGVHRLEFPEGGGDLVAALAEEWPRATFQEDDAAGLLGRIFEPTKRPVPLHLWVRGTNFQTQVWRALLRLGPGQLASYTDVARAIEAPRAVRAVGSALAANPIAFVIPCHRVLRREGNLGGYRWGLGRKLAMIGREAALSARRR